MVLAILFAASGLYGMSIVCAFVAGRLSNDWVPGRQGTGYYKLLLGKAAFPFRWDVYILKFPDGSRIDWHTDPSPFGEHNRMNIVLRRSCGGGNFIVKDGVTPVQMSGRVVHFRPDIEEHMVTEVTGGPRYVLSIGWISSSRRAEA